MDSELTIWRRPWKAIPSSSHVHWAAAATATARVELHRQLLHASDDAIAAETDCVYSREPLSRNVDPSTQGKWKRQIPVTQWRAPSPQHVTYRTQEGYIAGKSKGVPIRLPGDHAKYHGGQQLEISFGTKPLKSALRDGRGLLQRRKTTYKRRKTPNRCGLRGLDDTGMTHSVDCATVTKWLRKR